MKPAVLRGRSTVVRLLQFARAHWRWLLLVPPLIVVSVIVHVLAWAVAAWSEGARVSGLAFWPTRSAGLVMFGSMKVDGLPPGEVLSSLAPYLAWTLIASIGIVAFAVRSRARSGFVARLAYIITVVLPVVAIVMDLSTFASVAHPGSDAECLHDHRFWVIGVGLLLCTGTVTLGWLRFRVAFSGLSVRDYAIGWVLLGAVAALGRNSASIWSAFSSVAVDESPLLWAPPPHDVHWGSAAAPTESGFQLTAVHADLAGDILVAADVANGSKDTLYYFPSVHKVHFDRDTNTIVVMFGFERPTAPIDGSGEFHVVRPEFRALAPGESATLTGRVQPSFYSWPRTSGAPLLDVTHVDPATVHIVIKVAYGNKPLSLEGSNCDCWFDCGRVLADMQRGIATRVWR